MVFDDVNCDLESSRSSSAQISGGRSLTTQTAIQADTSRALSCQMRRSVAILEVPTKHFFFTILNDCNRLYTVNINIIIDLKSFKHRIYLISIIDIY